MLNIQTHVNILEIDARNLTMTKDYRGRHEIVTQMPRTANNNGSEGVSKTLIMYKSFLSYAQLKEYLSFLVVNGLLEEFPQLPHLSHLILLEDVYLIARNRIYRIKSLVPSRQTRNIY
ncbi:MAG TPA: winged helix-turn-helix domain-containing protein [Nitrososphaeraceae archaeon]|jgi:predicted transcriptional regulator|nr:winged helix-turn-helix domain-containing protein [Nitrososphaeraceae archaeon]